MDPVSNTGAYVFMPIYRQGHLIEVIFDKGGFCVGLLNHSSVSMEPGSLDAPFVHHGNLKRTQLQALDDNLLQFDISIKRDQANKPVVQMVNVGRGRGLVFSRAVADEEESKKQNDGQFDTEIIAQRIEQTKQLLDTEQLAFRIMGLQLNKYRIELKRIMELYKPVQCESGSLEDVVKNFLKSDKRCLLIRGDRGVGKSTFAHYLTYKLWKERPTYQFIPIPISAKDVRNEDRNLVGENFKKLGLEPQELVRFQEDVRAKRQKTLYIIDDGDTLLSFPIYGPNQKVIIFCQDNYSKQGIEKAVAAANLIEKTLAAVNLPAHALQEERILFDFQRSVLLDGRDGAARIRNYADLAKANPAFKDTLFGMITQSIEAGDDPKDPKAIAGSNALTILNAARIAFSGINFSRIHAPDAYLEGPIFDGTNLDDADLRNATLIAPYMHETSLRRTRLDNASFEARQILTFERGISASAFSPENRMYAFAIHGPSDNQEDPNQLGATIKLCDHEGTELRVLGGSDTVQISRIDRVAFSSDGKWLIAQNHARIFVWNIENLPRGESGKPLPPSHEVEKLGSSPILKYSSVAVSHDSIVATAYGYSTEVIALWSIRDGKLTQTLVVSQVAPTAYQAIEPTHIQNDNVCRFTSAGEILFSFSTKDKVRVFLWDGKAGGSRKELPQPPELRNIDGLYSSGDQSYGLSYDGVGGKIVIWNVNTGKIYKTLEGLPPDGRRRVQCAFAISHDGKWFAATSDDNAVRLWNLQEGGPENIPCRHTVDAGAAGLTSCFFLPNNQEYVIAGVDGIARILELPKKPSIRSFKRHGGEPTPYINSNVVISTDGNICTVYGRKGETTVWNVTKGEQLPVRIEDGVKYGSRCLSPDGKYQAKVGILGIEIHEMETGVKKRELRYPGDFRNILLAGFHQSKLVGFLNEKILMANWEDAAQTFTEIGTLPKMKAKIDRTGFAHGWLYAISGDTIMFFNILSKTTRVMNCRARPLLVQIINEAVAGVAIGKKIELFRLKEEGAEPARPIDFPHEIQSFVFSPDGKKVAISGYNDPVIVIVNERGESLSRLKGHRGRIDACAFSADGQWLSSISRDQTIRRWKLYNEKNAWEPRLEMTTFPILDTSDIFIDETTRISELNRRMLQQHSQVRSNALNGSESELKERESKEAADGGKS